MHLKVFSDLDISIKRKTETCLNPSTSYTNFQTKKKKKSEAERRIEKIDPPQKKTLKNKVWPEPTKLVPLQECDGLNCENGRKPTSE